MAALPRVLIELTDGTVTRIVSDEAVQVITVDRDDSPTIGLVVSQADTRLTREAMDKVLNDLLRKLRIVLMSDIQN